MFQMQKICFSGLSLVLKKRRFQLAYHQILPLVEVNQAIDAWSFRQGNNLPILHPSPKYRTQPLISIGIERKQKCNIHKHGRLFFLSTLEMFQWTFISPEEKEILAGLSPGITSCRSESSYVCLVVQTRKHYTNFTTFSKIQDASVRNKMGIGGK